MPRPLTDLLSDYSIYIDGDEFFDLPDICDLDTTGGYDFTTAIQSGTYSNSDIHRFENWSAGGVNYPLNRFYTSFNELVFILDSINPSGNWMLNGDRIIGGEIGITYGNLQVFSPTRGLRSIIGYNVNVSSFGSLFEFEEGCHELVLVNNVTECIDTVIVCVECPCIIPINTVQNITICKGEFVNVGDSIYVDAGTYTNTFTSFEGCESTVTTNLKVNPVSIISQLFIICEGESIQVGSSVYDETGTFNDTLRNTFGCDSIITTEIIVHPVYKMEQTIVFCNGGTYEINGYI